LAAEEVAQRVDAVGDVVDDEHPHSAAPQQAGQRRIERAADQAAEHEREGQANKDPQHEGAVDPADQRVAQQVRRVALLVAAVRVDEQPADVRVQQSLERPLEPHAVIHVGAVWVALDVGERVVLAVVGDPRDDRAFDRGRAEDRQRAAHPALGLERPVREVAVEADRHAQAGQDVADGEHDEVAPVQRLVPELPAHDDERRERDRGDRAGEDPVARLVLDGLYVVDSRGHHWRRNPISSPGVLPCRPFDRVRQGSEKQCTTAVGCLWHLRRSQHLRRGGKHGDRHREVVQRRQGLRVYHPRRARQGPLRPFLRDRGRRLPYPRRGRPGLL
jgi:hypothetical protein